MDYERPTKHQKDSFSLSREGLRAFGFERAAFLQMLDAKLMWLEDMKADPRYVPNFDEHGRAWWYSTRLQFAEKDLQFITYDKVKRAIATLESLGVIEIRGGGESSFADKRQYFSINYHWYTQFLFMWRGNGGPVFSTGSKSNYAAFLEEYLREYKASEEIPHTVGNLPTREEITPTYEEIPHGENNEPDNESSNPPLDSASASGEITPIGVTIKESTPQTPRATKGADTVNEGGPPPAVVSSNPEKEQDDSGTETEEQAELQPDSEVPYYRIQTYLKAWLNLANPANRSGLMGGKNPGHMSAIISAGITEDEFIAYLKQLDDNPQFEHKILDLRFIGNQIVRWKERRKRKQGVRKTRQIIRDNFGGQPGLMNPNELEGGLD